jgi:hypothetical protein
VARPHERSHGSEQGSHGDATALGALPMLSWGALGGQRGGRWHDGAVTMMNRAMVLHA